MGVSPIEGEGRAIGHILFTFQSYALLRDITQ
jgi:hypothetical protein